MFFNLAMRIRALFPKSASILRLVEQAFWRVPPFTKWVVASSSKVILARQSKHSSTGTFASRTSGSWCISLILPRRRARRRIRLRRFCTLIDIVAETAIVSSRTLFVGDYGVPFIISVSGFKILDSWILHDTSFLHCLISVITRSSFLPKNLHIVQFQYGLELLRLSYSWFVQSFQDVIRWDFRHW